MPQRLVQAQACFAAEAAHHRGPRHGSELANTLDTQAMHGAHSLMREPEGLHGQGRNSVDCPAWWNNPALAEPRNGPCRTGHIGDRRAGMNPVVLHTINQLLEQSLLAAKEMLHSRDVDPDAVRRIGCDDR